MKIPIGPRALPFFLFPNPREHFSFIFLFFPTFLQHKKASVGKRIVCAYPLSPTIKSWPFLFTMSFYFRYWTTYRQAVSRRYCPRRGRQRSESTLDETSFLRQFGKCHVLCKQTNRRIIYCPRHLSNCVYRKRPVK